MNALILILAYWHGPVISATRRWRYEDQEFKVKWQKNSTVSSAFSRISSPRQQSQSACNGTVASLKSSAQHQWDDDHTNSQWIFFFLPSFFHLSSPAPYSPPPSLFLSFWRQDPIVQPGTHRDPPVSASASLVMGLKTWAPYLLNSASFYAMVSPT